MTFDGATLQRLPPIVTARGKLATPQRWRRMETASTAATPRPRPVRRARRQSQSMIGVGHVGYDVVERAPRRGGRPMDGVADLGVAGPIADLLANLGAALGGREKSHRGARDGAGEE